MKFQCINCGGVWGEGVPEIEGYSHGSCLTCILEILTPKYRERQKKEGNPDCFRRSLGNCAKSSCSFWELCVEPEPVLEFGVPLPVASYNYAQL